jgi:hypothetical protein
VGYSIFAVPESGKLNTAASTQKLHYTRTALELLLIDLRPVR